jgi:hypothetical protein
MSLVDSSGRQITASADKLLPVIIQDMRNMAMGIGQIQQALLMQEIKVNFLVGLLQEQSIVPEDIDERWTAYAQAELTRIRGEVDVPETLLDPDEVPLPNFLESRESEAEVKV